MCREEKYAGRKYEDTKPSETSRGSVIRCRGFGILEEVYELPVGKVTLETREVKIQTWGWGFDGDI